MVVDLTLGGGGVNQILNTKIKKVKGKFSLVGSTKQE